MKLADVAHDIWSHWMRHLFKVGQKFRPGTMTFQMDDCVLLHKDDVERWEAQMNRAFDNLTDKEQASDIEVADMMLERLGISASRMDMLMEVDAERRRQDEQWGGPDHDDQHSFLEWRDIIHKHLMITAFQSDPAEHRRRLVNVAALAVATIESMDRKAAWGSTEEVIGAREKIQGEGDGLHHKSFDPKTGEPCIPWSRSTL